MLRYLGIVGILAAAPAFGHVKIISHPMRNGPSQIKEGPCGESNDARSDNINTFLSGSTINLAWDEFVSHPGHFRVAFDEDGDDFPNPVTNDDFFPPTEPGTTILEDNLFPHNDGNDKVYSHEVALPDVECDNCTLQLIQVMTEGGGNRLYFNCLDVTLTRDPSKVPAPLEFAGGACAIEATSNVAVPWIELSGLAFFFALRRKKKSSSHR